MLKIPITFTFRQKEYTGYFQQVSGGGSSSLFHLIVDGYYWGQLFNTESGWRFYSNAYPEMTEMFSDHFGSVVVGWTG